MADTTATLDLRQVVYYKDIAMYLTGMRVEPTAIGSKITYQVSQDLPGFHGWGRGPFRNTNQFFGREQLKTQAEYDAADLARIEGEANPYARTLTGIPVITLAGSTPELYVLDGTTTYTWDGSANSPYDMTSAVDTSAAWIDPGFTIADLKDNGQAQDGTIFSGSVTHDGTQYSIDTTEFTYTVSITYFDGTTTSVVADIDLTVTGRHTITYSVLDSQRIMSYPVTRIIEVHPPPSGAAPVC
jgi:hypothetical protein